MGKSLNIIVTRDKTFRSLSEFSFQNRNKYVKKQKKTHCRLKLPTSVHLILKEHLQYLFHLSWRHRYQSVSCGSISLWAEMSGVKSGWCRSRSGWRIGPSAETGRAGWATGGGSGSAARWRWASAARSSDRPDRPPAWRLSWDRGPPAGNRRRTHR